MLFEESYKTIEAPAGGIFKDRGSRFLGMVYPVKSEAAIKEIIHIVRAEHPKANHHCYAFRLGPGKSVFRFSDDREPAGSAGKPIYGVIQSNDLTDILIVVVRYFGGSMLGVPGLINAYRSAAGDAINNCHIITRVVMERYRLRFKYNSLSLVTELIKLAKATILFQQMELDCIIAVELPKNAADAFLLKIRNHYLLTDKCEITVL